MRRVRRIFARAWVGGLAGVRRMGRGRSMGGREGEAGPHLGRAVPPLLAGPMHERPCAPRGTRAAAALAAMRAVKACLAAIARRSGGAAGWDGRRPLLTVQFVADLGRAPAGTAAAGGRPAATREHERAYFERLQGCLLEVFN